MPVLPRELLVKGAAFMAEDDDTIGVGGAIAPTVGVMFSTLAGNYQIVSSHQDDLTCSIELTFRDAANRIQSDARTVQGILPIQLTQSVLRILKATKSEATLGVVAVEHQVATLESMAASGGADFVQLPLSAPSASGALLGQVLRITSGPASGRDIAQVIDYDGPNRVAHLSLVLTTPASSGTQVRIAPGVVFHKTPFEEMTVTRLLYDVYPTGVGGGQRKVYGKMFFRNSSVAAYAFPRIMELVDQPGRFRFGLDAQGVNGADSTGANTRLTAPAGVVFSTSAVFVDALELVTDDSIGVWVEETVEEDELLDDYPYQLAIAGD